MHGEQVQPQPGILGRQLARELTLDELTAVGDGQIPQCPDGSTGSDIMGSKSDDDCPAVDRLGGRA